MASLSDVKEPESGSMWATSTAAYFGIPASAPSGKYVVQFNQSFWDYVLKYQEAIEMPSNVSILLTFVNTDGRTISDHWVNIEKGFGRSDGKVGINGSDGKPFVVTNATMGNRGDFHEHTQGTDSIIFKLNYGEDGFCQTYYAPGETIISFDVDYYPDVESSSHEVLSILK